MPPGLAKLMRFRIRSDDAREANQRFSPKFLAFVQQINGGGEPRRFSFGLLQACFI